MKLRFYARENIVASVPNAVLALRQHIPRIGRTFVPPKDGKPAMLPATPDAHEIDLDMESHVDVQLFEKYRRIAALDRDVWCADEATARAFATTYVPVEFTDGVWVAKQPDPPKLSKIASRIAGTEETK